MLSLIASGNRRYPPRQFPIFELDLDAVSNCSVDGSNGVTISGLLVSDKLVLNLVDRLYTAWFEALDWRARFKSKNAEDVVLDHYVDAYASSAAVALSMAQEEGRIVLTGSTEYTLWIFDTSTVDNLGGLSFEYHIRP